MAYNFALPPAMNEIPCCSALSPVFGVVGIMKFDHSNRYEVVSYSCCLIYTSLVTYNVEYLFICLLAICTSSLVSSLLKYLD